MMKKYEDYVSDFIECSRIAYSVEPWEYKIINKNSDKMKKNVKKVFEINEQKRFFDDLFTSDKNYVRRWAACFSEIFNYDLQKSYEIFLEESKSKNGRPTDISGAKIAADRIAGKLKNLEGKTK